jgi:MFS superfamily sulfate permease-like transporter
MVGIIAAVTMLIFLLFLTNALALLPKTALAAIIIVSACGFFDLTALRELWGASGREFFFSLATTAGVLYFGVLPGVLVAVILSIVWLLMAESKPHDAILGHAQGIKGFHDINDYPEAITLPGLLVYRFDAELVFFNCDHFRDRINQKICEARTPVEWVVVDAGPINVVDYTALQKMKELRMELKARGIILVFASAKHALTHFFRPYWIRDITRDRGDLLYPTVKSAIHAFEHRNTTPDQQKA